MSRFDVSGERLKAGIAALGAPSFSNVETRQALGVVARAINVAVEAGYASAPPAKIAKVIWDWRDPRQDRLEGPPIKGRKPDKQVPRSDVISVFGRVASLGGLTSKVRAVMQDASPKGLGLPQHNAADNKQGSTIERIDEAWLKGKGIDPDEVYWAFPGETAAAPAANEVEPEEEQAPPASPKRHLASEGHEPITGLKKANGKAAIHY